MRLVKLPTVRNKYLDTIVHTFISCLHAIPARYDVALMFISGNGPLAIIPRLFGQKVILNVDGLDWKRAKWPGPAKKYIQFAEWLSTKFPHRVITDSKVVQAYYLEKYKKTTNYIAYGARVEPLPPGEYLQKFGLESRKYILFVGRLVPENCAHHLVEAFKGLDTSYKCVIVGDAPYAEEYIRHLKSLAGAGVIFTGYLFGEGYRELSTNAYLFVETSEVGGTHPALLEAMAFGNCVLVNDTAENLETMGDAGFSYHGQEGSSSLSQTLQKLLDNPELVEQQRQLALERVNAHYSWEHVTDEYEKLCWELLDKKR